MNDVSTTSNTLQSVFYVRLDKMIDVGKSFGQNLARAFQKYFAAGCGVFKKIIILLTLISRVFLETISVYLLHLD